MLVADTGQALAEDLSLTARIATTPAANAHGSMAAPRTVDLAHLTQWPEAFFTSRFTHSNLGLPLCKHPEGFLGMWRDLAGQSRFPVEYLLPKGTLSETLCRNHPSIV